MSNKNTNVQPSSVSPAIAKQVLAVRSSSIPKGWDCKCCGKSCWDDEKDYYMLKDEVWKKIFKRKRGMLCMDCVEEKLGRKLQKEDIAICPLTTDINPYTRSILNDR